MEPYEASDTMMPSPRSWMVSSATMPMSATTDTSTPSGRLSYLWAKKSENDTSLCAVA
ncbi:hypothetical protein D9M68_743170 [compost metagenome]